MDVKLTLEPFSPGTTALTGGGYAEVSAEIHVDSNFSPRDQMETAFHETIEAHLGNILAHDLIDQLAGALCDVKDQLEEAWKASTLSKTQTPDLPGDVKRFADVSNP